MLRVNKNAVIKLAYPLLSDKKLKGIIDLYSLPVEARGAAARRSTKKCRAAHSTQPLSTSIYM
jgi:hypothetical protein